MDILVERLHGQNWTPDLTLLLVCTQMTQLEPSLAGFQSWLLLQLKWGVRREGWGAGPAVQSAASSPGFCSCRCSGHSTFAMFGSFKTRRTGAPAPLIWSWALAVEWLFFHDHRVCLMWWDWIKGMLEWDSGGLGAGLSFCPWSVLRRSFPSLHFSFLIFNVMEIFRTTPEILEFHNFWGGGLESGSVAPLVSYILFYLFHKL